MRFIISNILILSSLTLITGCSRDGHGVPQLHQLTQWDLSALVEASSEPYVLVQFFRMDCEPCLQECQELMVLSHDQGMAVSWVLVSLDRGANLEARLMEFLTEHQICSDVYYLDPSVQAEVRLPEKIDWDQSLPFALLYTQQGRLVDATHSIHPKEVEMLVRADQSFPASF